MIAIIDYQSGNLKSVANALKTIGETYEITADPAVISAADRVIFPGQGRAEPALKNLAKQNLIETIRNYRKPFLGICIGMQLLLDFSEEDNIDCLQIIPGRVKKFAPNPNVKIPQVGWNSVQWTKQNPISEGIAPNQFFYFVNSYFTEVPEEFALAKTQHGQEFTSAIQKENFIGLQFHPEKSGEPGLQLLKNFSKTPL